MKQIKDQTQFNKSLDTQKLRKVCFKKIIREKTSKSRERVVVDKLNENEENIPFNIIKANSSKIKFFEGR